ncbi:MAG: condensation domain-containing protein, partial [Cellvibrio sp.]
MTLQDNSTAFRLSPQQRLGWLTDMPAPSLELHHHGKLDLAWLRKSLASLAERHESLRLRLQLSAGFQVPLQTIADSQSTEKHIYINDEKNNFPNAESDKVSVDVAEIKPDLYRIKITLPLLSADRGTINRLAESLGTYQDASHHEDMTYTQYSAWLYELQTDEDANDGHEYWEKNSLSAVNENDILYREENLHQHESLLSGLSESLKTSSEFFNALNKFCDDNDCSPENILITAWASLLQRLSTGMDNEAPAINLHWVHDCREDYDELSSCWGLFSKALPLHWSHSLGNSFSSAIAHMQDLQEAATEWQEYYAIESEPAPSRYGFEYGGELSKKLKISLGQHIELVSVNTLVQPFELLLVPELIASESAYRFNLHYDPRFYSVQTIKILLEQYQSLLT